MMYEDSAYETITEEQVAAAQVSCIVCTIIYAL